MYQEEYYDNDNYSIESKTNQKKVKSIIEDNRLFTLWRRGNNGRMEKKEVYGTGSTGSTIRNAITGNYYNGDNVGSIVENLYYSVLISTGECGKTPATLFFDTPEQYEKYFNQILKQESKKRWSEKKIKTLNIINRQ
jgi:hypothetical protein